MLRKFVPYVNFQGLSEYGFDEEECKNFDPNSSAL
jgi:hypothetical protein